VIKDQLAALGYEFKPPQLDNGRFLQAVRVGDLVFTSGQVPAWGDTQFKGKVGLDLDVVEAKKAAEICAVNCLQAVGCVAGLESITGIVKLFGMVNVADGFDNTPEVINGASEILRKLFGERAGHARSAVGMVVPLGWAVEIEMIVSVTNE
jgi:enamine deaminase RidA (YjgF/YER057c/UK114 family)